MVWPLAFRRAACIQLTMPYRVMKPGPYVRIGPKEVAVADADALKTIYGTKETFRKAPFYRKLVPQPIANVFSTDDVDYHRRMRRLMAAQLSESSLKWLVPTVTSRVELAIQRIKEEMKERACADVFKWSVFMATDVIGELAFGESFHMLEKGEVFLACPFDSLEPMFGPETNHYLFTEKPVYY
jgi:cytochrome P450